MTTTQELFDHEQAALALFESAISQSPGDDVLSREVARLEGKLEQLHGMAVMAARRTDQIEEVTAIWHTMMSICERVAKEIQSLAAAHPECQTSYDKVLDLWSDCKARHQFHV